MADYWKSQPRKFCQYCKCWIADNKPSIEFHERGKNHKENVAAKISEIKKKSVEKAKQEERMSKQFAAMEEAAMKAYEEDLKRIDMESKGLTYTAPAPAPPKPQPKPKPKPPKKKPDRGRGRPRQQMQTQTQTQTQTPVWVEGLSDDGHTYYYNTITGESRWEKPGSSHGESSGSVQYEQTQVAQSSAGCAWMEAVSPDGFPYYYNSETGESSWEKPADFPSTQGSDSTAESKREGESQQEASTPLSEPLSGGDESSSVAAASQEAEVHVESSQQLKIQKIFFKKRKVEAEPLEKEEDETAYVKSSADTTKEDEETKKKEEDVQSTPVEAEKTMTQTTKSATRAKRPRTANPYGVWEKIQEEEDPYAKVDLQLPQVEESTPGPAGDMPPEPKPKFKERIITSIGGEGDGPAWFRKNKTTNGKSRSLRQRDDDD